MLLLVICTTLASATAPPVGDAMAPTKEELREEVDEEEREELVELEVVEMLTRSSSLTKFCFIA